MNNELICPFCNKKLEPIGTSGQFQCVNWRCDASFNFYATRDVWEYIERTRKALVIAKDKLDTVRQYHRGTAVICPDDIAVYCDRAIEQIIALEQKD